MKQNTAILLKNSIAVHSSASLSLVQRKAINSLIRNAFKNKNILEDEFHYMSIRELLPALGYADSNHKSSNALKQSLFSLSEINVKWNILKKDNSYKVSGQSPYLSGIEIINGTIKYAFSKHLREIFFKPNIYARLDLNIQKDFINKNSIPLWELMCEELSSRKLQKATTKWLPYEKVLELFSLEHSSYIEKYKYFKYKVLKSAVKEINEKSDIKITFLEKKAYGRKIDHLMFVGERKENDDFSLSLKKSYEKNDKQIKKLPVGEADSKDIVLSSQRQLPQKMIDDELIDKLKITLIEEVGGDTLKYQTIFVEKQLIYAYRECFKEDLEVFKNFCRKISSSKFLMGEATSFKARINWLFKPEIIKKIQEDFYSSGDRKPNHEHLEQERGKSLQTEEITNLKQESTKDTALGMISKLKLFIINRFSYGVYVSWFRNCEISIKQNKLYITGDTRFASDYIETHYLFDIETWFVKEKNENANK